MSAAVTVLVPELWNLGTLEPWNLGTLEPWNLGTLELWGEKE